MRVIAQIQQILPYKSLTYKTCKHTDCTCSNRYRLPFAILYNKFIFKTVLFGLRVEKLIGISVKEYFLLDEIGLKSVAVLLDGFVGQIVSIDFRGPMKNGFVTESLSMAFSTCNPKLMLRALDGFYRDQLTREVSDSDDDSLIEALMHLQMPTQKSIIFKDENSIADFSDGSENYFESEDDLDIPKNCVSIHKSKTSIAKTDSSHHSCTKFTDSDEESEKSLTKEIQALQLSQTAIESQAETRYVESYKNNFNDSDFSDDASLLNELFGLEIKY